MGGRALEKASKTGENYYCTEVIPQNSDKSIQELPDEKQ